MRADTEAERAHARGLVAQALQGEAERRARDVPHPQVQHDAHRHADEVQLGGLRARVAQHPGQVDIVDPAEARHLRDLRGEVVDEDREGQRQHQEVDPLAARRDEAEDQADERAHGDRGHDRQPRVPGGGVAAVGGHEVGVGQAGGAVDRHLAERHHAAVGRQEDQAGGGQTDPQRLREDLRDPEVRHHERRQDQHGSGEPDPAVARERAVVGGLRLGLDRGGLGSHAHAGLPNRPSGRTASTTTSSANVSRIE